MRKPTTAQTSLEFAAAATKSAVAPSGQTPMQHVEQLEKALWEAADNLRANSKLTSSEYCMPVLGVIFLRHAMNRYEAAKAEIAADIASGKMADRQLQKADFIKRRAMMLPLEAQYPTLIGQCNSTELGATVNAAMNAIERDYPELNNQLPMRYQ